MNQEQGSINFRSMARDATQRARVELASGDNNRTRYAALELRMALEALTYSKAQAYEAELSKVDYETWEPKKLMQRLLDIDPHAAVASTWRFGVETHRGEKPEILVEMGSDQSLTLAVLKTHYSALGSYLHTATLLQFRNGKLPDMARLATRCSEIVTFVEAVLASTVFDVNIALRVSMDCLGCGKTLQKRIPPHITQLDAQCRECSATYILEASDPLEPGGPRTVTWKPQKETFTCSLEGCGRQASVWRSHIKAGAQWTCHSCNSINRVVLGVVLVESEMPELAENPA